MARIEIVATPASELVVTPAPTLRNVSLNHTAQAGAFVEVILNVTPLYQFVHWPRRQAFRFTLSRVWFPSHLWMSPFAISVAMVVTAMDNCPDARSALNFASMKSRTVQLSWAHCAYAAALFRMGLTAVTPAGLAAPWAAQYSKS